MGKRKNPTARQKAFGAAGKKAAKKGLKPGTPEFGAEVKKLLKKA